MFGLAILTGIAGAMALYLGAPRQQLLSRPWPGGISVAVGTALTAASGFFFVKVYAPLTAVFAILTLLMSVWTVTPLIVSVARRQRGREPL